MNAFMIMTRRTTGVGFNLKRVEQDTRGPTPLEL
jgi:hypothetical protein